MKAKRITLTVLFIIMSTHLYAENLFGLKLIGGNNFITHWQTENDLIDRMFLQNFSCGGGLVFSFTLNTSLSLQGEIDFIKNNVSYKASSSLVDWGINGDGTYTTTFSYYSIDLPLFLLYTIKNVSFYAGPYLSFPETYFAGLTQTGEVLYLTDTIAYSKFVAPMSFVLPGVGVGVIYTIPIKTGSKLQIDVRFIYDFNSINTVFNRSAFLVSLDYFFASLDCLK